MAIKTTVVGSYPAPRWLLGDTSRETLRDAVMLVLKSQELAGIDVVADGELNRLDPGHPEANRAIDYFLNRMDGIRTQFTVTDLNQFRADPAINCRSLPAGIVISDITEGILNLPADFEFTRALTRAPLKFTCSGPHMLARSLTDRRYGSSGKLCMAIANVLRKQLELVDADIVQLDEGSIGRYPEDTEWALPAINHTLDGVAGTRAVHICFGDDGGQNLQQGFWRRLMPFLNGLKADHVVLEFARRGYSELEEFKDLNPKLGLGLGVVDVKDSTVEHPDVIAGRVELAANLLGPGRIQYIHPDCGFSMLPRQIADGKMQSLVAGRNLFEGRS